MEQRLHHDESADLSDVTDEEFWSPRTGELTQDEQEQRRIDDLLEGLDVPATPPGRMACSPLTVAATANAAPDATQDANAKAYEELYDPQIPGVYTRPFTEEEIAQLNADAYEELYRGRRAAAGRIDSDTLGSPCSDNESPCQDTSPKSLDPAEDPAGPENLPLIGKAWRFGKSATIHYRDCRISKRQEVSSTEELGMCSCIEVLVVGEDLVVDCMNTVHAATSCLMCSADPPQHYVKMCRYCICNAYTCNKVNKKPRRADTPPDTPPGASASSVPGSSADSPPVTVHSSSSGAMSAEAARPRGSSSHGSTQVNAHRSNNSKARKLCGKASKMRRR